MSCLQRLTDFNVKGDQTDSVKPFRKAIPRQKSRTDVVQTAQVLVVQVEQIRVQLEVQFIQKTGVIRRRTRVIFIFGQTHTAGTSTDVRHGRSAQVFAGVHLQLQIAEQSRRRRRSHSSQIGLDNFWQWNSFWKSFVCKKNQRRCVSSRVWVVIKFKGSYFVRPRVRTKWRWKHAVWSRRSEIEKVRAHTHTVSTS